MGNRKENLLLHINNLEKVAVLYSKEQKAWHIESLNEYMESNVRFILGIQEVQQYRLIMVFDNYDNANIFIKANYDKFN